VVVGVVAPFALIVPVATASAASSGDPDAARAAREIQDARDRANAAAQALFDAESEIDSLDIEIADAEARVAELEGEVGAMRDVLAERAVRRYMQGSTAGNLLFTPVDEMNAVPSADVYAGAATGAVLTSTDDFEARLAELEDLQADLADQRDEAVAARERFEQLRVEAEQQVVDLQRIEEQRLADVAVQRELDRIREEKAAEAAREAEEAAAQQAADEAARQAADEAARQAADDDDGGDPAGSDGGGNAAASDDDNDNDNDNGNGNDDGGNAEEPTPEPPAPEPPAPEPPAPPPASTSGIVCPVNGARAFADTWGAPRSGGRSHQGVDIISPQGTPLVAVESGSVNFKTTPLGGNSVWLHGNSGTAYFYAHLSAWEGSSRSVSQGEVIGYVGHTGNTSVDHLHFEVHPGGGSAVNPYPYVAAVC
jgi:murein DD-endopeptidase MepM/ murein hydrolase activator NlpD